MAFVRSYRDLYRGLVASYNFNEGSGTVLHDSSGYDNNGDIDGATWTDDVEVGKCLDFDGLNDYIENSSTETPIGSLARTFSAWTYLETDKRGTIISQGPGGTLNGNFDLEANVYRSSVPGASNYYGVHFWGDGVRSNKETILNEWVHVCVSHAGGNLNNDNTKVFINGRSVGLIDSASINTASTEVSIGDEPDNDGNDVYFDGKITNVRIYDRSLNPREIKQLYNMRSIQ